MDEGLLVNVAGAQRSGTTMLDLMLGSGERAFSCGEVFAYFRPFDPRHFSTDCRCGRQPCPVWERLDDLPEQRFHRGVVDRLEVETVVDSSKALDWIADTNRWASESRMRVANVLIWKDPLNLGYSFWKRGWLRNVKGPRPPRAGEKDLGLETFVVYYERFFDTGLPHVSVSYENLVSSPPDVLASLCTALKLPYRRGQERFWERTHHYLFGSHTVGERYLQGDTGIFRPELPAEFLEAAADFVAEVEGSARAQAVIAELKATDVGSAPVGAA